MIKFFDYQDIAVEYLTGARKRILGDEVGMGKTFPAIEVARLRLAESPEPEPKALIVVPGYAIWQWYDDLTINMGIPFEDVYLLTPYSSPPVKGGYYLAAYSLIQNAGRRKAGWVWRIVWDVLIADEAHRLRNPKSQQTSNANQIPTRHAVLITGSPMTKGPADIFGLLHMCDPKEFRSYWQFVDEWCKVTVTPWAKIPKDVKPEKMEEFQEMVDKYMIRRLKRDYQKDLPEPLPHYLYVDLPPAHLKEYRKAKKEYVLQYPDTDLMYIAKNAGAMAIKLRQFVSVPYDEEKGKIPKSEVISQLLGDMDQQPVIIFTWFKSTAERIRADLTNTKSQPMFVVHGDLTPDKRTEVINTWKTLPNGVLIGTMSSMGESLNLQNSSTVIFAEHDYVPKTIEQAIGRVSRTGQMASEINVYHILTRKTIDEKVLGVAQGRYDSITAALAEEFKDDE